MHRTINKVRIVNLVKNVVIRRAANISRPGPAAAVTLNKQSNRSSHQRTALLD